MTTDPATEALLRVMSDLPPEVSAQMTVDEPTDAERARGTVAWVRDPTGSVGLPARPDLADAELLADIADLVQDAVVEALPAMGRPAVWPSCPLHPDTHPMTPAITDDGIASWTCPRDGRPQAVIGSL